MSNLQNLLKFTEFTQKFRNVERSQHHLHEKRPENDAEHSFQLAIIAWYIVTSHHLKLDIDKIIKYALVHDLVEVYSGDTPIHFATSEMVSTKKQRETEALERIRKEFPDFPEMHAHILEYENMNDDESVFIYALDKLLPDLIIYLDKGYAWRLHNVTWQNVMDRKLKKVSAHPHVKKYFVEIMDLVKKNEKEYFG